jgi:hypothetical protein
VRAPRLHHIMSAAVSERYHGPIGRSVTDFTVVRRRKGSLLFCGAKCRTWPIATRRLRMAERRFRCKAEMALSSLHAPLPTALDDRGEQQRALYRPRQYRAGSVTSTLRTSPVGVQRRSCSLRTRLAAWRRTSLSCRSCCASRRPVLKATPGQTTLDSLDADQCAHICLTLPFFVLNALSESPCTRTRRNHPLNRL